MTREPTMQEILAAEVTGKFSDTPAPAPQPEVLQPPADVVKLLSEKPSAKPKKITLTLSPDEWAQAVRSAAAVDLEPKEWLANNINAMLSTGIGKPKIHGPSGSSFGKVTGPSSSVEWK